MGERSLIDAVCLWIIFDCSDEFQGRCRVSGWSVELLHYRVPSSGSVFVPSQCVSVGSQADQSSCVSMQNYAIPYQFLTRSRK